MIITGTVSMFGNPVPDTPVWQRWQEEQGAPNTLERILLKHSNLPTQYPADGPDWPPVTPIELIRANCVHIE